MKHFGWLFFLIFSVPSWATDEIHSILTVSADLDDENSRFFLVAFDRRLAEHTWVSVSVNHAEVDGEASDPSSQFFSIGLNHDIGQWQLSLGVDYWEVDGDNLDSTDITAGIYYQFEKWTVGLDLAHRDTQLRFVAPGTDRRLSDDVTGEGIGLGASYAPSDDWYFYANYMTFDYEGRIVRRPAYEAFSRVSFTADDSLLDYSWLVGADYYWDRYSLGIYTNQYRSAFDRLDTTSYNLTGRVLLTEHADMQVNFGVNRPDEFENTLYGGIGFTFYW